MSVSDKIKISISLRKKGKGHKSENTTKVTYGGVIPERIVLDDNKLHVYSMRPKNLEEVGRWTPVKNLQLRGYGKIPIGYPIRMYLGKYEINLSVFRII